MITSVQKLIKTVPHNLPNGYPLCNWANVKTIYSQFKKLNNNENVALEYIHISSGTNSCLD